MQRLFKGYPIALICAPMGPQHSEGGREAGYNSVFVSAILCVNCYIAVSVLSVEGWCRQGTQIYALGSEIP